jgi:hypothetical protein
MFDTYTMITLGASLAVVLSCIVLPILGAKQVRKFMAADAAAANAS